MSFLSIPSYIYIHIYYNPLVILLRYATLNYISDAVALDAFSQCHRYVLKGNPISVNFAFKLSSKKQPTAAVSSSVSSDILIRPQIKMESAQKVGKVLIQSMKTLEVETGSNEKLGVLKTSSLTGKSSKHSEPQNVDKMACEKSEVIKNVGTAASKTSSTSILSQMVKQAKNKITNEKSKESLSSNVSVETEQNLETDGSFSYFD